MIDSKENPLVSVYIPTYNRLEMLKRAIASVLNQTYTNYEIILVDDGSNDGTKEYIKKLSKSNTKVKVLEKQGPRGACSSRNLAIRSAKGFFVTGLDDDDYFSPNRLEILVRNYRPEYAFISTNHYRVLPGKIKKSSLVGRVISKGLLLNRNAAGQVMVEKERFISIGGFDESLKASQDVDAWLRLTLKYGSGYRLSTASYYVDEQHDKVRISVSENRIIGTEQFLKKHEDIIPSKSALYKEDCYVTIKNKPSLFVLYPFRYGIRISLELLRIRLGLG
ncbi:glycosyltransferase [Thiopseudomonas alkaliphila]|uniref:Glycosyltransferase n=1 Tax=Thiopseudomonas alkaliphila TaxID=1697053 RepID=A0AAW7DLY8_9GAMM|nr:glycosyltransferase [Thiopseudomonas alkaliphila]MDM1695100.1 glycosyltransferase [Thiopseudomonas alkaliphila]